MSKYYALKVEGKIVFIIPWDKKDEPTLSDFQFAPLLFSSGMKYVPIYLACLSLSCCFYLQINKVFF